MSLTHLRVAVVASFVLAGAAASAEPLSKEACVDAHSRGQDARDSGKLSLARKLFLTCAQSSCPGLVQNDCARFANDLSEQQPTVTFAARDSAGNDLPDTTVYVDDILMVTRLDDGRPHDVDPGRHAVKFQNNGHDLVMTIVLNTGEKGRAVIAKFPSATPDAAPATKLPPPVVSASPPIIVPVAVPRAPAPPATVHPFGAKLAIVAGGVAVIGGGVLAFVGSGRVPSDCSTSTHTCTAAPGDPELDTAHKAVKLEDIGLTIGAVGAAALVGGFVWYFTGSHSEHEEQVGVSAVPWISPTGGGISLTGRL